MNDPEKMKQNLAACARITDAAKRLKVANIQRLNPSLSFPQAEALFWKQVRQARDLAWKGRC